MFLLNYVQLFLLPPSKTCDEPRVKILTFLFAHIQVKTEITRKHQMFINSSKVNQKI